MLVCVRYFGAFDLGLVPTVGGCGGVADVKVVDTASKGFVVTLMSSSVAKRDSAYP